MSSRIRRIYIYSGNNLNSAPSTNPNSKMQKASVKTLSIIDTLSELVQDEGAATQLASPAPASTRPRPPYSHQQHRSPVPPGSSRGHQPPPPPPPQLKPRSPKVNNSQFVPSPSPPQFLVSSPKRSPASLSPLNISAISTSNLSSVGHASVPYLNGKSPGPQSLQNSFGAKVKKKKSSNFVGGRQYSAASSRGQTPDWIREIFLHAKRGFTDKLVSKNGVWENLFFPFPPATPSRIGSCLLVCGYVKGNIFLKWMGRKDM